MIIHNTFWGFFELHDVLTELSGAQLKGTNQPASRDLRCHKSFQERAKRTGTGPRPAQYVKVERRYYSPILAFNTADTGASATRLARS